MPAAAPAAAPIAPHVAPPVVAAAASTPPLVMAELPSTTQTVHMSSVHMTHTPLAMHSTQLPPTLASSGGQITLGMPAGYSHTSCAPSGYNHGGGATSEGAP
jgi:hypothetical protein